MYGKTQRKLVFSLAIVLAWLGFIIEGSRALFSDSAVLAGNTITTGTVDLQVSNSQNGTSSLFADSRPGFTYTLNPGQSVEKYFFLKNTSPADVPFRVSATAPMELEGGFNPLAQSTSVEFVPVDSAGEVMGQPISITLSSLRTEPLDLGILIESGAAQRMKVRTSLASSYTGQGESVSYDLFFTGVQNYVP